MKQTQMTLKTKKISKGHYEFTYDGEVFKIVNNEGLYGFTWNCVHVKTGVATETKISKSYLIDELSDFLLDDFFTYEKEFWPIQVDENGLF